MEFRKETITDYLTNHMNAGSSELAALLGGKPAKVKKCLSALIGDGIIAAEGAGTKN